jgi:hypothetical protein
MLHEFVTASRARRNDSSRVNRHSQHDERQATRPLWRSNTFIGRAPKKWLHN